MTMLKMFGYFLFIVFLAALFTEFSKVNGDVNITFADYIIHTRTSILLSALCVLVLGIVGVTWGVTLLLTIPGKLKAQRASHRRAKGMLALTRGLEAVAAGDASDAQHHAKQTIKNLVDPALTRLLTAQAAQLAGDEDAAEQSFAAMLEAPETEFLGLRGLHLQALGAGEEKSAHQYAERAFKLRPNARWAFESFYQSNIKRGAWGNARDALQRAVQNGAAEKQEAKRHESVLATAIAYATHASGYDDAALKDLEAALRLSPTFVPAATLAANLYNAKGKTSKALKTLEDAFAKTPHPAIRCAYIALVQDYEDDQQAHHLHKLYERNPDSLEGKIVLAYYHLYRGEHTQAITIGEEIITDAPNVAAFTLMAAAVKARDGEEANRFWLAKAANAPVDPVSGDADGNFHFTADGWRRLTHEYGVYARLAPPPLEEALPGMSKDEVRLHIAPPQKEPPQEKLHDMQDDSTTEDEENNVYSAIVSAAGKQ